MVGCALQMKAQTSNVTTAYNLDKGAIEISFDLAGPENSLWNVNVALVQKKDSKVLEIPASNINKSLRGLSPGKQMFEIINCIELQTNIALKYMRMLAK
jgi:hypothetical protein